MNAALTEGAGAPTPAAGPSRRLWIPGAAGPLGRCAVVYMDDILVHSASREQHLKDVEEVLATLRRHKLFAKSSKCEFGRQELGFLGHRLSAAGVSVDPLGTVDQGVGHSTILHGGSTLHRSGQLLSSIRRGLRGAGSTAHRAEEPQPPV